MIFLFIKFGIKEFLILKTNKILSGAGHALLFKIEDMKCRRCVNKINEFFVNYEGLSLEFNLENKTLLIAGEGVEYIEIKQILHEAGFTAELLK
jgi:copper chaperone CopZ